jgi:hypothetical protein
MSHVVQRISEALNHTCHSEEYFNKCHDITRQYGVDNTIFVFGSNLGGIHGAGSAQAAYSLWGAEFREGVGLKGFSYAIPTKDKNLKTLPLDRIKVYVDEFLELTKHYQECCFILTEVGCGLAGYSKEDIAPMFSDIKENIIYPEEWMDILNVS